MFLVRYQSARLAACHELSADRFRFAVIHVATAVVQPFAIHPVWLQPRLLLAAVHQLDATNKGFALAPMAWQAGKIGTF